MARFRATPYAKALHDVVLDKAPDKAESVVEHLDLIAQVVETVPDFLKAMVTPAVSQETKVSILESVLKELGITDPTSRFLQVVQRNYRLEHLPEIRDAYRDLVDRSAGRVRAKIEVPAPLSDADTKKLVDAISGLTEARVVAEFTENPELLAGFRAQIGSKVFDGSLIGQLDQLRRQTLIEQG
jgi:F-type H+-transporting ATPase subunit delta